MPLIRIDRPRFAPHVRRRRHTDVASFAGVVGRTATLEVVEAGDTATVVEAGIAVNEARRSAVARHAVRRRPRQVRQRTGLVELQTKHRSTIVIFSSPLSASKSNTTRESSTG